jgi:integrase/recombinase XerD
VTHFVSACSTSFSAATTPHPRSAPIWAQSGSLPEHFHCSPEQLGPEHVRRYLVLLLPEKKLEPSTVEIRIPALRFLYKRTLRLCDFTYDDLIFPKVPQKLPIERSQGESCG